MTWKGKSNIFGLWRQTKGAAAVEFAIISMVFFLLIGGVIDFGFCYYMKQTITNASREGARYGITWRGSGSPTVRVVPSAFTPTIANVVLNTPAQNGGSTQPGFGLKALLPSNANPTVTFPATTPNGYTTGAKGDPLQVQVTAVYHWFLISAFIPGMSSTETLTASSVMLCE